MKFWSLYSQARSKQGDQTKDTGLKAESGNRREESWEMPAEAGETGCVENEVTIHDLRGRE